MRQTERKEGNKTEEGKKKYHHWIKRLRRKGRRWPDDVLRPADCSDVVRRRDGPVRRISDRVTAARKQIRDVTYVSKASCGEAQRYSQNVASLGGLRNLPLGVITDPPLEQWSLTFLRTTFSATVWISVEREVNAFYARQSSYFLVCWYLKTGCGDMDWIQLAQDRNRWRARVNAVRVP